MAETPTFNLKTQANPLANSNFIKSCLTFLMGPLIDIPLIIVTNVCTDFPLCRVLYLTHLDIFSHFIAAILW